MYTSHIRSLSKSCSIGLGHQQDAGDRQLSKCELGA